MHKIVISSLLLFNSLLAAQEQTPIITQPKFITVHMNMERGIRINVMTIKYYRHYYPYDDPYSKTEILLIDGANIPVLETPDEIDLMLSTEVSKPREKPKLKN